MHITISKHAAQRAIERGITEEGIRAIVDGTFHPFVVTRSRHDPMVNNVLGIYKGKVWSVILNKKTRNVITVRRARKYEEEYYERNK